MSKLKFPRPKKKSLLEYTIYLAVAVIGIAADQFSKWLTVVKLENVGNTFPLIDGVLHFTYVKNTGAAFGSFKDARWVFMTISTIMIIALTLYLVWGLADNLLYGISVSMIISGGIGNMIDRISLGYVVDFIDFRLIDFAVFNIADSFVCVGAGILILALILDMINEAKKPNSDGKTEDGVQ